MGRETTERASIRIAGTKIKLGAAILFAALVCLGWAASSRAAQRRKSQPRPAASASVDANTLYGQRCASCHGENGDADTEKGRLYGATNFADRRWWGKTRPTDARLRSAIANGKRGGMPAFGKKLSAQEISALASFVRGFKGK
jgi:mono/diheme cytochrome c family protein